MESNLSDEEDRKQYQLRGWDYDLKKTEKEIEEIEYEYEWKDQIRFLQTYIGGLHTEILEYREEATEHKKNIKIWKWGSVIGFFLLLFVFGTR